jgi:hypothetical protein
MVDSDGLLKWAPHNLLTYSEDFSNAAWGKTTATVTANAAIAPDGANTADKLIAPAAGNFPRVSQAITIGLGAFVCSVYAKAGEVNFLQIMTTFVDGSIDRSWFDLSTGVVGTIHPDYTPDITDVGNGWYRCSLSATKTVTGAGGFESAAAQSNGATSVTNANDGIYIWGAHLYRSDLGGMVDNPDTGNSYVPTTTAARYLPRRGHHVYNGSEWVNEGLLVESEARTNLVTYSNLSAGTTYFGASGTLSATTGPDGETSGVLLQEDGSTGVHRVVPVGSVITSGVAHCASVFAKAKERTEIRLTENAATGAFVTFNLSDGSIVNSGLGGSGIVEDAGNGWYRCTLNFTSASTANRLDIQLSVGGAAVYAGDGASGAYIYGAQFEAGSVPSSLTPTSGATVTRPADTLTVPSANLPWPSPVVIGEELVTNGTFDTDTDWTKGAGFTIAGGVAVASAVSVGLLLSQSVSTVSGRAYRITYTATVTDGGISAYFGVSAAGQIKTSSGTFTETFIATGATTAIGVQARASAFTGSIDNISVREINPLAVSIQMDGTATGDSYTPTRWYLDANNAILQDIGTTDFTFTQEAAGVVDTVTGGSFTSGVNIPFNIASRHGSTFINGSLDGTALTADTTPTALPDLSATNLNLAFDYMGTIRTFRVWADDLGDTGIAEATEGEPSSYLLWDATADTYVSRIYD